MKPLESLEKKKKITNATTVFSRGHSTSPKLNLASRIHMIFPLTYFDM